MRASAEQSVDSLRTNSFDAEPALAGGDNAKVPSYRSDLGNSDCACRGQRETICSPCGISQRGRLLHQHAWPLGASPYGGSIASGRSLRTVSRRELEFQRKPSRHLLSPWRRRKLAVTDLPIADPGSVEGLRAEVDRLSSLVVAVNDAVFGLSGILTRAVVDTGLIGRSELADTIEHRAGPKEAADHNPLLLAFARAIRMNFPGGSFDVIDGGKTS